MARPGTNGLQVVAVAQSWDANFSSDPLQSIAPLHSGRYWQLPDADRSYLVARAGTGNVGAFRNAACAAKRRKSSF